MVYRRQQEAQLKQRLSEPVQFINILSGPRQVGKTTIVRNLIPEGSTGGYFVSVDEETVNSISTFSRQVTAVSPPEKRDADWLRYHWNEARDRAYERIKSRPKTNPYTENDATAEPYIFAIDEIQKIQQWSEVVKGLWDSDRSNALNMHVILLGSAPLLMQKGLSETLAGRYEITQVSHWSFNEMQEAFDLSFEEYIYFGGYPGSASLIHDESRWRKYVRDSLIQPNIEKDILQMVQIKNPMLLKQLFELGCHYSSQELSLTKMISALNDAKHTETLANYLQLLQQAKLLAGLHKHSVQEVRKRNSAPKLNVFNTALISATQDYTFAEAQADRSYWGRLVESAVGAHLLNTSDDDTRVSYWRDGSDEVDFILTKGNKLTAIEVKSASNQVTAKGLDIFVGRYTSAKKILVGSSGIQIAEFLSSPSEYWMD